MKANALIIGMVALAGVGQLKAASFQGLGWLPGYEYSGALDVSADGAVVVGYSGIWDWQTDHTENQASRWGAAGEILGLGFLAGHDSSKAEAVSADGSVVVGTSQNTADGATEAFRWTQAAAMVGLGFLPGADSSHATAVSADGSVVVGYSGDEAFRWTQGEGMQGLGLRPWIIDYSRATGVSADGSIVVGYSGGKAVRWTQAEGLVNLGFLPGLPESKATAISADGSTLVGSSSQAVPHWGTAQAFRWTEAEGMVSLGVVGYVDHALDVSADGSAVVGTSEWFFAQNTALLWDPAGGLRNLQDALSNEYGLDLTGWRLSYGTGVSDDGAVLVGRGINPSDQGEAWRAVVAEPRSLVLAVVAALVVLGARCRRRGKAVRSGRVKMGKVPPPTVPIFDFSADGANFLLTRAATLSGSAIGGVEGGSPFPLGDNREMRQARGTVPSSLCENRDSPRQQVRSSKEQTDVRVFQ